MLCQGSAPLGVSREGFPRGREQKLVILFFFFLRLLPRQNCLDIHITTYTDIHMCLKWMVDNEGYEKICIDLLERIVKIFASPDAEVCKQQYFDCGVAHLCAQ